QLFDKGIAVWDRGYVQDVGYARLLNEDERGGRECSVLAAVLDLRRFTRRSDTLPAAEIQSTVEALEGAFQKSFGDRCWKSLFVKGTGDGLVVVSEEQGFLADADTPEHTAAFLEACVNTIAMFRKSRPAYDVGCGIDAGPAKQIFLLGQTDYLSPALNHAAHNQDNAVNEIRLTRRFAGLLEAGGEQGHRLASKVSWVEGPTGE